jgi:UDP-N-acetylmuramoylalanine--D-glutamate ligase
MKIAILGFGLEGKSILNYLKKSPEYRRAKITICDENTELKINDRFKPIIDFKLGNNYLKGLCNFNIIFRSPGMPYNLPEIKKAVKKGIKFSSATKLFFEQLRRPTQTARRLAQKKVRVGPRQVCVSPHPIVVGITGTKGKGTVSTLLYKILKAAKKDAYLAGNIGKPAIEILSKLKKNSVVILELSSFQLWDLNYSPDIAVVLDIFPDHLDSHKNFKEYFNAKANIAKWQKKNNKIFYFPDNKYSKLIAQESPAKKIAVDSEHSDEFVSLDYILKIPGRHNLKNAVMAANVALSLGCPKEKIISTIKKFRGNEHRLELVRAIRIHSGHSDGFADSDCIIKFYNDSASTNPQTAAAAIKAFKEPKILIAGGKDKNLDYSPLAQALKNSDTKLVILFGENKNKIKRQVTRDKRQEVVLVKDLKSAVNLAYKTAKSMFHVPCFMFHVIFSPASASFDMFKDYKERGEKFKEIVKELK